MRIGFNAHLLSFVPGYRRAGVSQYTEQILRHIAGDVRAHHDTLTVYLGGSGPYPEWLTRGDYLQLRPSRLPTGHAPGRILWEQAVAPVTALRDRLNVLFCPVNVVPLIGRVPTVVTVHDLAFLAHPEAFRASKRRYLTAMTRLSVRHASRVIAVSAHTKDDLISHFGIASEKVSVVPNAMDERFTPAADRHAVERFREDHGLPDRFILFVGTLEPRKNLRRLIEAFALLSQDDTEISLVIVGATGWMTSDLAPLVHQRGLVDRVIFPGYVPDEELPQWYRAATLFCYPSLYEGFGLPVLEAMACGTPVLTSATSSIPALAGGAALLVDPTDVAALVDGLRILLSDPARCDAMRAAGLARAREFSWARTAAATFAVIGDAARA